MEKFLKQFHVTGIESPKILISNSTNAHNGCGEVGGLCGSGYCGDEC
jgi:hypothetical protein